MNATPPIGTHARHCYRDSAHSGPCTGRVKVVNDWGTLSYEYHGRPVKFTHRGHVDVVWPDGTRESCEVVLGPTVERAKRAYVIALHYGQRLWSPVEKVDIALETMP